LLLRRLLHLLIALAAVASIVAIAPRFGYDRAWGNRVELTANLGDIVEAADREGLPVGDVLRRFAEVGLTSVIAEPALLAELEAERGPFMTIAGGPAYAPLLRGGTAGEAAADAQSAVDALSGLAAVGVPMTTAVFDGTGTSVPGYPGALEVMVDGLDSLGLTAGFIESPEQLGYVNMAGTTAMAELLDHSLVRVYRVPDLALHTPARLADKAAASVKERSLRVVWLDLFNFHGEAPASWMTHPGGEDGVLAANLHYVERVVDALHSAGFTTGKVDDVPGRFTTGSFWLTLTALGPWAAGLLLLNLLSRGRLLRRRLAVVVVPAATLLAAAALLAVFSGRLAAGQAVLLRQAIALGAALVYPTLAGLWLVARWTGASEPAVPGCAPHRVPGRAPGLGLRAAEVAWAVFIAILGGLAVAATLSGSLFALELNCFRGIKLSYVVPPLAVLAGGVWVSGTLWPKTGIGALLRQLLALRLQIWHVVVGLALTAVAVVYVGRSGDLSWLPVSGLEVAISDWLNRVLYAQPRLKECLVGYPALIAGAYLALTNRRRWLPAWGAMGTVGLISIVNSFEHVRTPLGLTLVRTANGATLGVIVGLLLVLGLASALDRSPGSGRAGHSGQAGDRTLPGTRRDGQGGGDSGVTDAVRILGVRVDSVDLDRAADMILRRVQEARGVGVGPGDGAPFVVVTPNPEMVMAAQSDLELLGILNAANLAVADGIGLVWAARRRGADLPGRVAGFDLLTEILERGSREGLKVFLLGSRPGVAADAARRCLERWPGLEVAGTHHGYFPPADDEKVARLVAASGADLVAVGMGSPRQERWIARQAELLGGLVAFGVGGSLDVLSGRVKRAPDWMARRGLEWLGRFISQPGRWRRAPALARFVLAVLSEERRTGRSRSSTG